MNRRILIAVGLAAALLAPSTALASHMGQYATNPIEHDDQGRSDEPDDLSTSVLGVPVSNAIVDLNMDGFADVPTPTGMPGKSRVIAPGCTDGNGDRAMSGQCGAWTVGIGTGLTGTVVPPGTPIPGFTIDRGNCPSRYGGTPMVFLDSTVANTVSASGIPTTWIDVNRKLADADETLGGLLTGLGANPLLVGGATHWAWYGLWEDKNCNGVIDHLQTDIADPSQPHLDNEFVWYGACVDFENLFRPETIGGGYCSEDPNPNSNPKGTTGGNAQTTMVGYIWPGQHGATNLPDIDSQLLDEDPFQEDPDLPGDDRTGELSNVNRHWLLGFGFPSWYFDQSLILNTWVITGVNCKPDPDTNLSFFLGASGGPGSPCTFLDVDLYESWSPLLEPFLLPLRSTLHDTWVQVNDLLPGAEDQGPISRLLNQVLGKDFYDATGGPQQGLVDDLAFHPGWAREPNVAPVTVPGHGTFRDVYVDVVNGGVCDQNPGLDDREEQFRGWCNVNTKGASSAYAAYQGDDFRGFLDVRPQQIVFWLPVVDVVEGGQCIQCLGNVAQELPFDAFPMPAGGNPADPADHTMALQPGQWVFEVFMGRWKDAETSVDESVFPGNAAELPCDEVPEQAPCKTYPKDGWVGFLAGGIQEYEGYLPEECATDQGFGLRPWAECNPYVDGNVQDPQAYGDADEWENACQLSSESDKLVIYPADGEWSVPAVVWKNYQSSIHLLGNPPDLDVRNIGDTEPLTMVMRGCNGGGFSSTTDHLFLPAGTVGENLVTAFGPVDIGVTVGGVQTVDFVTDVDFYGSAVV